MSAIAAGLACPLLAPAAGASTPIQLEYLRMTVGWTPAGDTAGLITSSTVMATPVKAKAAALI